MKKMIMFFVLLGLFLIGGPRDSYSQARFIFDIDPSDFPAIKGTLVPYNMFGLNLHLEDGFFDVTENGESMNATVRIDSSKKAEFPGASIIFLIDISSSMNTQTPDNPSILYFDWLKHGVHLALDSLKFVNGTEVAILPFFSAVHEATFPGFHTDTAKLHQNVRGLQLRPGRPDLYEVFNGAFNLFKYFDNASGDKQRHIIFVSDGEQKNIKLDFDGADEAIAKARENRAVVHSIQFGTRTDEYMEWLIKNTGGHNYTILNWFDNEDKFRWFCGHIQNKNYYQLVWDAPYGCDESSRNRNFEIDWYNNVAHTELMTEHDDSYIAPESSIMKLSIDEEQLVFGDTASVDSMKSFKLNFHGPEMTVNSIGFDPQGNFVIKDWGGTAPPFTMTGDESRIITVAYPEEDKPEQPGNVSLVLDTEGYPCDLPELFLISLCTSEFNVADQDFGEVMVEHGEESVTIEDIFTNNASIPLKLMMNVTGDGQADFSFNSADRTVSPGESVDLSVDFTPSSLGVKTATIEFSVEPEVCGGTASVTLSGEGIPSGIFENELTGAGNGNLGLSVVPNPASTEVSIYYELPESKSISIELYNSMGTLVQVLANEYMAEGSYRAFYSLEDIPAGVYFLRLSAGRNIAVQRLVITK